jgi:hypothetical protein
VKRLFHPTHWVPNLADATGFLAQVFGRHSQTLAEFRGPDERHLVPGYPTDYCTFTPIAEVLFDCVDPTLHLVDGVQVHESVVEPHLGGLAWFVDGIEELWVELLRRGIRGTDQANVVPADGSVPRDVSSTPIIFTLPGDAGLRYEFCPFLPRRDPRGDPPAPDVSPSDPLGIERCSHHTILTDQPDRALQVLVEVLRGQVIDQGRNDLLATRSTYVALADAVFEVGQPLEDGSPAMDDWQRHAPDDTYHALTWHVRDIDQVGDHLKACGVGIRTQTPQAIVTDPADSLGVPWGFTTVLTPGDRRA